jgi:ribosome-binding factor A
MPTRRSSRRSSGSARDYPRTARLNELVREIVADELERLDDERFELLTVISVVVDPDLRRAVVFYDCLDGEDGDEEAMAALGEARVRLQAAIGRQARIKRTPELSFRPDPSVRSGERIDAALRDLGPLDPDGPDPVDPLAAPGADGHAPPAAVDAPDAG